MAEVTATGSRCARCSAAVRPGAPWCTQCYAPAGATAPERAPGPSASGGVRVAERAPAEPVTTAAPPPSPAPVAGPTGGSWPCTSCSQPNDLALSVCSGCGTPFLAAVRAGRPTVVLPVVGDLLGLSPVRRVALAVGVVLAFLLVTALLGLLLA